MFTKMNSTTEEIEQLRRSKMFSPEDIRLILKRRKSYEQKVNNNPQSIHDFRDPINYEKALFKTMQKRRNDLKLKHNAELEYRVIQRIHKLYEMAIQKFPTDDQFCLSYIKFCQQSNGENVCDSVEKMLKAHPHIPAVWQAAAFWYIHDRKDLRGALKILNRGLTLNKTSQLLYKDAIKLALSAIQNGLELVEGVKIYKSIQTYVELICQWITDDLFLIKILNMIEAEGCIESIQNVIIAKLLKDFSHSDVVWHTLAQREKRELHYGITPEELRRSGENSITLCFAKYQEGLRRVPFEKKANLLANYLDCLLEIQNESNLLPSGVKVSLLKGMFEEGSKEKLLSEKYYLKWLEVVPNQAFRILELGTSAIPSSLDLWIFYLRYATVSEINSRVDEVFYQSVEMLKERSLPLWTMYLRYYTLLSQHDILDSTYQKGVKQPHEISDVLKPKYIEWLALTKGISEARAAYNKLAEVPPFCKDLHVMMAKLESFELEHDFEKWVEVHKVMVKQFGEEDVDVWINFVLFFVHFNKSAESKGRVEEIRKEAMKKLSPFLTLDFMEKFEKACSDL